MNNSIKITVASPILRPGMTISTKVSEKYAPQAYDQLLDLARKINAPKNADQ